MITATAAAAARILVVDDDPGIRDSLTLLLREQGYEVGAVEGGTGFLEALERRPPDLVLLDVVMPGADGFELLARVKADDRWSDLPIVMLSSLPAEEATITTLGLGACDYVRKPFRVRELLARIQHHIRHAAQLRARAEAVRHREEELARARQDAVSGTTMVDLVHEVTGELAPEEIYHILARRVARALQTAYCSVVIAHPDDVFGRVATAYENPAVANYRIELARYPEIQLALRSGEAVLVEDVATSPIYEAIRHQWVVEGVDIKVRSAIAIPFRLDEAHAGVFFLRRALDEPALAPRDLAFARTAVRAAVTAIQRARILADARADAARLEHLAQTDPLTGLPNRRVLVERLAAEVERSKRYGTQVSILLLDIDHFKRVNDGHGHLVGDEVLVGIAQLLRLAVRAVDVVARYGGEEFVVILPETAPEGATTFAERVRERVAEHPFPDPSGRTLRLTTSIGIATFPGPRIDSVEDLVARADEALYRAKAEGRNRVRT